MGGLLIECLSLATCCSEYFTYIISFNLHDNSSGEIYLYFRDGLSRHTDLNILPKVNRKEEREPESDPSTKLHTL